jgi:transcriptional regulator with XRE-family HTH domain
MSKKLGQLKEQGLANDAFREGYEARGNLVQLGILLQQTREASGLTQDSLAAKIGMKPSTISRLESGFGPHGPEMDALMRFVHGCGAELVVGIRSPALAQEKPAEMISVAAAMTM